MCLLLDKSLKLSLNINSSIIGINSILLIIWIIVYRSNWVLFVVSFDGSGIPINEIIVDDTIRYILIDRIELMQNNY